MAKSLYIFHLWNGLILPHLAGAMLSLLSHGPYPQNVTPKNNGNRGDTNFNLIGTAYYARSVELTIKTAEVLGHDDDVLRLKALHSDIKEAFLNRFFDEDLKIFICARVFWVHRS